MRWYQIVNERYLNLFTIEDKQKYAERVFELIQNAYAAIGGHVGIPNVEVLLQDTNMWKLVRKNNVIILACLYKDNQGRKFVAIGHDGSEEAKRAIKNILMDDIKQHRMWAEVSGAAARSFIKAGVPVIPNKHAQKLLNKEILSYDGEYKYSRLIGGKVHTKILIGYPNGTCYDTDAHVDLDDLLNNLP